MPTTKDTKAIRNNLYPLVEKSLRTRTPYFRQLFSRFVDKRSEQLFATGPLDRISYTLNDAEDLFNTMQITKQQVKQALSETYFWSIPAFNPRYAKDEITMLILCIIRYFSIKKDRKSLEMAMIYLSFSGKFYPSIHFMAFPKAEPSKYAHIMAYVINNLSNKYEIKSQGSVFGAVRKVAYTWYDTYEKDIETFDDEDCAYLVQQLHNRIKAFMKNIAKEYYKAYENKDYISFDGDNVADENDYHLADSDSMKAERIIEHTMEKINTMSVDYRYCKMAADTNVKAEEVKSIIESILNTKVYLSDVKEYIRILVYTYFQYYPSKDVSDISFITFSIAPKPNSKDPHIIRAKEIVTKWLEDVSERYNKRKKRIATKNSYERSVAAYFTFMIHVTNK